MPVLDTIKKRRSIRSFQDKFVSQDILTEVIEALLWAPSAGNLQSRHFYFVTNSEKKQALALEAAGQDFIKQAPVIVVACAHLKRIDKYGERGRDLYVVQDVAASLENAMLLLTEKGLGSCWVGKFNEDKVRQLLNLPEELRPVALLPIGYPATKPVAKDRLPTTDLISWLE